VPQISTALPWRGPCISDHAFFAGWTALLPLHAAASQPQIDTERVRLALAQTHSDARVLDLKRESDALYADYLRDAMRLSLAAPLPSSRFCCSP